MNRVSRRGKLASGVTEIPEYRTAIRAPRRCVYARLERSVDRVLRGLETAHCPVAGGWMSLSQPVVQVHFDDPSFLCVVWRRFRGRRGSRITGTIVRDGLASNIDRRRRPLNMWRLRRLDSGSSQPTNRSGGSWLSQASRRPRRRRTLPGLRRGTSAAYPQGAAALFSGLASQATRAAWAGRRARPSRVAMGSQQRWRHGRRG
jgi:hypothetical protein